MDKNFRRILALGFSVINVAFFPSHSVSAENNELLKHYAKNCAKTGTIIAGAAVSALATKYIMHLKHEEKKYRREVENSINPFVEFNNNMQYQSGGFNFSDMRHKVLREVKKFFDSVSMYHKNVPVIVADKYLLLDKLSVFKNFLENFYDFIKNSCSETQINELKNSFKNLVTGYNLPREFSEVVYKHFIHHTDITDEEYYREPDVLEENYTVKKNKQIRGGFKNSSVFDLCERSRRRLSSNFASWQTAPLERNDTSDDILEGLCKQYFDFTHDELNQRQNDIRNMHDNNQRMVDYPQFSQYVFVGFSNPYFGRRINYSDNRQLFARILKQVKYLKDKYGSDVEKNGIVDEMINNIKRTFSINVAYHCPNEFKSFMTGDMTKFINCAMERLGEASESVRDVSDLCKYVSITSIEQLIQNIMYNQNNLSGNSYKIFGFDLDHNTYGAEYTIHVRNALRDYFNLSVTEEGNDYGRISNREIAGKVKENLDIVNCNIFENTYNWFKSEALADPIGNDKVLICGENDLLKIKFKEFSKLADTKEVRNYIHGENTNRLKSFRDRLLTFIGKIENRAKSEGNSDKGKFLKKLSSYLSMFVDNKITLGRLYIDVIDPFNESFKVPEFNSPDGYKDLIKDCPEELPLEKLLCFYENKKDFENQLNEANEKFIKVSSSILILNEMSKYGLLINRNLIK